MSDPFRDEATAALARMAELQSENEELRDRLAEAEKARKDAASELETTATTGHGLSSRLQRENEELTEKVRDTETKLENALVRVRRVDSAQASVDIKPFLTGAAGFAIGMAIMFFMKHC
jgi:protein subunit release factor A